MTAKMLSIAVKSWRESIRERRALLLTFGIPIVFMVIFGFAFGGDSEDNPVGIAVINNDAPGPGQPALGQAFVDALNGVDALNVREIDDRDAGIERVESRRSATLVVIPRNFSAAIGGWSAPASLEIVGDPSFMSSGIAESIVTAVLDDFVARARGGEAEPDRVAIASIPVTGSEPRSTFDFIAPGLMVFAILNLAPQTAAVLAAESERGTLTRLKLSRMTAFDLLAGVSLARVAVSAIAVILMFGAALAMGYRPEGSLLAAILIGVLASLAVIGLGLIVAAFAKNRDDAANIGTLIAIPASFLSGAFFPMPDTTLFQIGDRAIEAYDILPTTHAANAMRQVLTFGNGLDTILFDLAAMTVLAVLLFAVGLGLYRAKRLAAD